jgi:hypothetical protein
MLAGGMNGGPAGKAQPGQWSDRACLSSLASPNGKRDQMDSHGTPGWSESKRSRSVDKLTTGHGDLPSGPADDCKVSGGQMR